MWRTKPNSFELIGERDHYDYIVASHVIEHTVDLLGFLLDCQALLKPDGALVLAAPDTRFSRHSIEKFFDELAYN